MPGLVSPSNVEVPAALQYVLDHVELFGIDPDGSKPPMGTAVSAAAALDGCWGAGLVESGGPTAQALFLAYHFDSTDGTYISWSALGQASGELAPLAPLVTEESGAFVVESGGVIRMTAPQMRANLSFGTGGFSFTLQVLPTPTASRERTLKAGLDGDELTLRFETDDSGSHGTKGHRILFRRYDCPAGELRSPKQGVSRSDESALIGCAARWRVCSRLRSRSFRAAAVRQAGECVRTSHAAHWELGLGESCRNDGRVRRQDVEPVAE